MDMAAGFFPLAMDVAAGFLTMAAGFLAGGPVLIAVRVACVCDEVDFEEDAALTMRGAW